MFNFFKQDPEEKKIKEALSKAIKSKMPDAEEISEFYKKYPAFSSLARLGRVVHEAVEEDRKNLNAAFELFRTEEYKMISTDLRHILNNLHWMSEDDMQDLHLKKQAGNLRVITRDIAIQQGTFMGVLESMKSYIKMLEDVSTDQLERSKAHSEEMKKMLAAMIEDRQNEGN
jgi:hypothetical protein